MRVINWNIERRRPASWQASSLMAEIGSLDPDIVCLTEAHIESTASLGGHKISARGVCWAANYADTEQKVVLWSRNPWTSVETFPVLGEIGGIIGGSTQVGRTQVRVLGVCIPYQHASPFGAEKKSRYFEEHERFLVELGRWFIAQGDRIPSIVLGDFNRGVPRDWGPLKSYEMLMETFSAYHFATAGLQSPDNGRTTIDHIAIAPTIRCRRVEALSAIDRQRMRPRSDHFGVLVDLVDDENPV